MTSKILLRVSSDRSEQNAFYFESCVVDVALDWRVGLVRVDQLESVRAFALTTVGVIPLQIPSAATIDQL